MSRTRGAPHWPGYFGQRCARTAQKGALPSRHVRKCGWSAAGAENAAKYVGPATHSICCTGKLRSTREVGRLGMRVRRLQGCSSRKWLVAPHDSDARVTNSHTLRPLLAVCAQIPTAPTSAAAGQAPVQKSSRTRRGSRGTRALSVTNVFPEEERHTPTCAFSAPQVLMFRSEFLPASALEALLSLRPVSRITVPLPCGRSTARRGRGAPKRARPSTSCPLRCRSSRATGRDKGPREVGAEGAARAWRPPAGFGASRAVLGRLPWPGHSTAAERRTATTDAVRRAVHGFSYRARQSRTYAGRCRCIPSACSAQRVAGSGVDRRGEGGVLPVRARSSAGAGRTGGLQRHSS